MSAGLTGYGFKVLQTVKCWRDVRKDMSLWPLCLCWDATPSSTSPADPLRTSGRAQC